MLDGVLRFDHSTSHYGVLGLWEAEKRNVHAPEKFWKGVKEHWIKAQKSDGGWSYTARRDEAPYGSMTAAGVTVLLIAQQQLYRNSVTPNQEITKAIDKGMGWLNKRFTGHRNPLRDGQTGYYLYAVERVALASGMRHFNKEDWFRVGAKYFMQNIRSDGSVSSSAVDSCFALMFLSRGRVPVWASKIELTAQAGKPSQAWNNRPNDLYFLTDFLTRNFEQEINWQVLSADASPEQWMSAPVAYLASHDAVKLTDKQRDNLKRYLDLGGTLVVNPDNGSAAFTRSIEELAKDMYPSLAFADLPSTHPIFSLLYPLGDAAGQKVRSLSNGARDLIIMPTRDWGFTFQTERYEKNPASNTLKLAANMYAWLSDRGRLEGRLVPRYEPRRSRPKTATLKVARVQHKGDWQIEPRAWEQVSNRLFNLTGLDIDTSETIELSRLGTSGVPIAHMVGTQPITLSRVEQAAISRYVRNGGTLLIENVAGSGKFVESLEKQLSYVFRTAPRPIPETAPLITAKGLSAGYDNKSVDWRPFAVMKLQPRRRHRLAMFDSRGRPAVILSNQDLSLGAMGVPHQDILGYAPKSARRLLINLAIMVNDAKKK